MPIESVSWHLNSLEYGNTGYFKIRETYVMDSRGISLVSGARYFISYDDVVWC